MKDVGIYYRVSTDKQELVSQIKRVEDWLAALPEQEKPKTIKVFKDKGISGKSSQRPGYQALLKAAFERKIDTIIVYRLDRMSRNASEAIQTLLSLDQAGVGFISVTQAVLNLGPQNPFRRTMLAAFSEIAEIERETIVSRVRSGLEAAKRKGVKLGRPQKLNEKHRQQVLDLRKKGLNFREIATTLGISRSSAQTLAKLEPNTQKEEGSC